jgi:hypothetical protein
LVGRVEEDERRVRNVAAHCEGLPMWVVDHRRTGDLVEVDAQGGGISWQCEGPGGPRFARSSEVDLLVQQSAQRPVSAHRSPLNRSAAAETHQSRCKQEHKKR